MNTRYDWNQHGFVIIDEFFKPEELQGLADMATQHTKKGGPDAYPFCAVALYDLIQAPKIGSTSGLDRMPAAIESTMGQKLSFYNSIYLEMHADKVDTKPGFGWHQDTASFAILEKGTPALFTWTVVENTLDDGQGTLELILREKVTEITGCDLQQHQGVIIFATDDLFRLHGIDLRWKAKFVLLNALSYQILAFFDTPLDEFAERPVFRAGDLLICNKDIMHRSAPTKALTGKRSALTMRFVDPSATYNGCLDEGVPLHLYGVYCGSTLWQRLYRDKRGAPISV